MRSMSLNSLAFCHGSSLSWKVSPPYNTLLAFTADTSVTVWNTAQCDKRNSYRRRIREEAAAKDGGPADGINGSESAMNGTHGADGTQPAPKKLRLSMGTAANGDDETMDDQGDGDDTIDEDEGEDDDTPEDDDDIDDEPIDGEDGDEGLAGDLDHNMAEDDDEGNASD